MAVHGQARRGLILRGLPIKPALAQRGHGEGCDCMSRVIPGSESRHNRATSPIDTHMIADSADSDHRPPLLFLVNTAPVRAESSAMNPDCKFLQENAAVGTLNCAPPGAHVKRHLLPEHSLAHLPGRPPA